MTVAVPVHGLIDGGGRLVSADPPLVALQAAAGGSLGSVLAVPQLASLVRLVRRLGIVVSRGIVAAQETHDLELWVRAAPEGEGVRVAIAAWRETEPRPGAGQAREDDIARASGIWTWECDATLRIVDLPAEIAARLDATPSALGGQPLTRLFALEANARGAIPLIESLAEQRGFEDQAATLRGDTAVRLRLDALPVRDGDGRLLGFRGTATPAPAADAAAGDDAFGERLGDALRRPLDRIVRDAEAIRARAEGALRADYVSYAGDIASAGRHLLALVGDLVDLSAIERSDFRPHRDQVDLAEVARRAAGLLGVRAASRDVAIERPADTETLDVIADYGRTMQILVNLIGNAVRYSPSGATVSLHAERGEGRGLLIVADRGPGIAKEHQARIFEKFERVDPSEPGGTGLGLYIARRLAQAMGGEIVVDSAPDEGARFAVSLPLA